MEIVLLINDEEKTFVAPFISGRKFRKTIEMQKKFRGDMDEKTLDSMVDFVVDIFGNQFSRDQFYDGIAANKLISTVTDCINEVVGSASLALGVDPNAPNV